MTEAGASAYIGAGAQGWLSPPVLLQGASSNSDRGRRPGTREARLALFTEATDILAKESSRSITLDEVARRVAASPRQLQRVFTEHAGLGFRAYLRRLRMSHAAELLVGTDLPVKDIAGAVGYSDASQLTKAFKRTYGMSPSQYRAMPEDVPSGRVGPSPAS
jgi:transcriptional regulator GlxA family with amidase domain